MPTKVHPKAPIPSKPDLPPETGTGDLLHDMTCANKNALHRDALLLALGSILSHKRPGTPSSLSSSGTSTPAYLFHPFGPSSASPSDLTPDSSLSPPHHPGLPSSSSSSSSNLPPPPPPPPTPAHSPYGYGHGNVPPRWSESHFLLLHPHPSMRLPLSRANSSDASSAGGEPDATSSTGTGANAGSGNGGAPTAPPSPRRPLSMVGTHDGTPAPPGLGTSTPGPLQRPDHLHPHSHHRHPSHPPQHHDPKMHDGLAGLPLTDQEECGGSASGKNTPKAKFLETLQGKSAWDALIHGSLLN